MTIKIVIKDMRDLIAQCTVTELDSLLASYNEYINEFKANDRNVNDLKNLIDYYKDEFTWSYQH